MLNKSGFILLAGNPKAWDDEMLAAKAKDLEPTTRSPGDPDFNLCAMQRDQFRRGRRSAQLVKTLRGWSVRSSTNLDNQRILAGGRDNPALTVRQAIAFGVEWANQDPANREFFMLRSNLDHLTAEERAIVHRLSDEVGE